MGKNKKKNKEKEGAGTGNPSAQSAAAAKQDPNPLLTAQSKFLSSLPPRTRNKFFSNEDVSPEQRAEIWEQQADLGEALVDAHAWATPDQRLLKVFQYFGPIVEVGCGANAYWSRWMSSEGGVDVVALDVSLDTGGKIADAHKSTKGKGSKKKKDKGIKKGGLAIRQGGPEALSGEDDIKDSGRTLFLCYPDEEDFQPEEEEDEDEDTPPMSMAAACLEQFTGNTIIHVGELYGDTLSLDQAPFGRSSSSEFQQRLSAEYHCILKMKLENNWLHVRDTLSVWKRSETCCMAFGDDEDDDDDDDDEDGTDEMEYKYIPPEEVLPVDVAAPCVAHLLCQKDGNANNSKAKAGIVNNKRGPESNDSSKTSKKAKKEKGGNVQAVVVAGKTKADAINKKSNNRELESDASEDSDDWEEVIPGEAW